MALRVRVGVSHLVKHSLALRVGVSHLVKHSLAPVIMLRARLAGDSSATLKACSSRGVTMRRS